LQLKPPPVRTDKRCMILLSPLSRRRQLELNARAFWRDMRTGHLGKMRFHLHGLGRAILAW